MKGPEDDPERSRSRPVMNFMGDAANWATVSSFFSLKVKEIQQGLEAFLDAKIDAKMNQTQGEAREYINNKLTEFRTEERLYLDQKFLQERTYHDEKFLQERTYQDEKFQKQTDDLKDVRDILLSMQQKPRRHWSLRWWWR